MDRTSSIPNSRQASAKNIDVQQPSMPPPPGTEPNKSDGANAALSVGTSPDTPQALFQIQQMAPAPSQTYYQLTVLPSRGRTRFNTPGSPGAKSPLSATGNAGVSKKRANASANSRTLTANGGSVTDGCVILRDWPRKRLSQMWTRNGMLNPSQRVISFDEFLDGELKEELIWIFGESSYNDALDIVKKVTKKPDGKAKEPKEN